MTQAKRDTVVLQIGGKDVGCQLHLRSKNLILTCLIMNARRIQRSMRVCSYVGHGYLRQPQIQGVSTGIYCEVMCYLE